MIMNDVIKVLQESSVIGITFHTSPDGDSLGSSLALMLGLRKLKKRAYIICKEKLPDIYRFLPGSHEIDGFCSVVSKETQCLVALDCGNAERLNGEFNLKERQFTLLNIDHHLSNTLYGDLNYRDSNASAVGEIVYNILNIMGIEIDKDIAICLYTSIVTDCGSFSYSNTTAVTHQIAGELIKTGIDFPEIHREIYNNKNFNKIKLAGKVINSMYLELEDKLCVMELTKNMLNEIGIEAGDTSDVISIGMEIDCIEVAALFKERDNEVRVSLRSKHSFDVRRIAEIYGGGGHSKAAGFTIVGSMEEAKRLVIKQIEKELI